MEDENVQSPEIARRVRMLQGNRPYTPWADSIGMSRTTMWRLTQGKAPDAGALVSLQRAEGVSLDWLLTGAGTPYRTSPPLSAEDAALHLDELLGDEPSQEVFLLVGGGRCVLALRVRQEIQVGMGRPYRCWSTDVLVDPPCSDELAKVLRRHDPKRLFIVPVDGDCIRQIASGQAGPVQLWGWEHNGASLAGVCRNAEVASAERIIEAIRMATEPSILSDEERGVLDLLRRLKGRERSVVIRCIRGLAANDGDPVPV